MGKRLSLSQQDRTSRQDFGLKYSKLFSRVERDRERRVFGGNYGCDGYTTQAQAAALVDHLDLAPGRLLLDLGSGRGWPGPYLAKLTGCQAVLTDVPIEGLVQAKRATRGTHDRVWPVVASPRRLPFRRFSFDAIVHTDVLC